MAQCVLIDGEDCYWVLVLISWEYEPTVEVLSSFWGLFCFFLSPSQLIWKLCGNWNIHTVEILMSPANFSLQNWAQDACQEDCPLGSLPVGGLASLLDLAFIERFLTVSVPVEVCFYKSAFFYRNKKKFFLEFLIIVNEKLKGNWGISWPHLTMPSKYGVK